ncbi:hypothetical protein CEP49_04695 [Mergibacter septicus]|nr:hypothetical protein CEP49_04695 [Mergibacter septicus]
MSKKEGRIRENFFILFTSMNRLRLKGIIGLIYEITAIILFSLQKKFILISFNFVKLIISFTVQFKLVATLFIKDKTTCFFIYRDFSI